MMSWGHDEYLYRVLRNHGATLPDEALYMIRYEKLRVYIYLCVYVQRAFYPMIT